MIHNLQEMTKLKFQTENAKHGLSQAKGFAWFTKEEIEFGYQVLDTILEVVKSDLKEAVIPFQDIYRITYEKSWLSGHSVLIELNSLKNVNEIPFIEETTLCVELDKKDRDNARDFVAEADLTLANFRNEQLDKL